LILSLLSYKRTVTLYIPATYLTGQDNTHTHTHTTWGLINQHFGNTILSNPDQSHTQSITTDPILLLYTFLVPKTQY